jgi:hypothetical protein
VVRRGKLLEELRALQQELDVLRAENARLRLQRQVPASLGAASERSRARLDEALPADEREDAALTDLANAAMIRASVIAVCQEVRTTFAQLEQRLLSGVPLAEQDRRVNERRSGSVERRGANGGDVPRAPFSEGPSVSPAHSCPLVGPTLELSAVGIAGANGRSANGANGHSANGANGHSANSANGHSANGHSANGANGHSANGHIANGANGHSVNGYSSNGRNGKGANGRGGTSGDRRGPGKDD